MCHLELYSVYIIKRWTRHIFVDLSICFMNFFQNIRFKHTLPSQTRASLLLVFLLAYRFFFFLNTMFSMFLLAFPITPNPDSQNILTAFRPSTTTPRSSVISTVQNTVGNSLQSLPFSLQSIVTPLAQTLGLVTPPPAPIPWYAQVIERIQQFARYPLTILRNGTLVQLVPTHIGTIPNVLHPAIILQMMDSIAPTTTTRRPSILGTLGVGRRTTQPPSNDLLYDNSAVLTTKRPHQLKPQSRPHPAHTSEDMITIRSLLNAHKKIPLVTETTSNTSNSSNSGEQSTVLLIAEMDAADEPSNGIALPGLDNTAVRKKLNSEQLE